MTLAERRRQGCLDYLRAVVDTINGPMSPTDPTPRTVFRGVDMVEHWGEVDMRFHIFMEKSKDCSEAEHSMTSVSENCVANKGGDCGGD